MATFLVVSVRGTFLPFVVDILLDSQLINNLVFCTMLFSIFIIVYFVKEQSRLKYLTYVEEQKLVLEG